MANDLEKKIIKQFEYYFGDYNLPRDKFLNEEILTDDGWVEINTFLKFPRLTELTTELNVIVEALKKAENDLVVLSEDNKKIRRNPDKPAPELTKERKEEIMNRTAYAKGFPMEESLDDIIAYFDEHGPIESCYKRTYFDRATKEKRFKGSCFIIFKNLDDCKKFVEAEGLKYKDNELLRKFQTSYLEDKKNEIQKRRNEKKGKKLEKFKAEESKLSFPKQAVLFFSGITDEQVLTREEIKDKFTEITKVEPAFIDYKKGDKEGYIRLPTENGATEVYVKFTDGLMDVGDVKLQFKVLEGEEEDNYLQKAAEIVIKRRQLQKKGKKNFNFKRKAPEEASASKRVKV